MRIATAPALAVLVACSAASTATVPNVAGTYLLSIVDGTNGCRIPTLTEGQSTSGVPLAVAQDSITPQNMTVTFGGTQGATMNTIIGTRVLTGTLGSLQVALTPVTPDAGTPTGHSGSCSYVANAAMNLTFAGDTVQGTLTYTLTTNGNGCGSLTTCQTVQAIAGVLTPSDT